MELSTFSFQLTPTDPTAQLGFEAWVDDHCMIDTAHVMETVTVSGNLPDNSAETTHILKLVLKNKQAEHTKISNSGEILQDACLTISKLTVNDIELDQLVNDLTVYEHDFNGSSEKIKDKFFGIMGCNGTVTLNFTTPIYLWLLKHM